MQLSDARRRRPTQTTPRSSRPHGAGARVARAALLLTACGALLGAPRPTAADATTGTWTGDVHVRGNYYWERSTRVIAPTVGVHAVSPKGTRVDVDYLVDSITSASVGAGALEDTRFTELRHDVGVGVGHELELGERQLDLSGHVNFSREPDYTSVSGTFGSALSLRQRTTVLNFSGTALHDEVRRRFRGGSTIRPGSRFADHLNAAVLTAAWSQVINRRLICEVGYDVAWLHGYLANPYRTVRIGLDNLTERHPRLRWRHTLSGRLALYLPRTHSAIKAGLRAYADSWDIRAIAPDVQFYQALSDFAQLRLTYRYYAQSSAFFYESDPSKYPLDARYFTADPKMADFHSHLGGLQLRLALSFLAGTRMRWLADAVVDFNLDYTWSTSAFGDNVLSELGLTVPF
ncbi:MAG: DUF3570 domain-containing protein [Myxococcales bacterium]|nr:DUF3570 domain-containing protein [Myxococcales bacterium]